MTATKFNEGDRVRLSPTSKYYPEQSGKGMFDGEGIIRKVYSDFYSIDCGNYRNSYRDADLILINPISDYFDIKEE